ncbi:MAG: hypothetical protein ABI371_05895 [Gelidibacter sp.]
MNNKFYLLFFLMATFAFASCDNDDGIHQDLSGEYVGTFTVEYLRGEIFTNPVTVIFSDKNNYKSSGNSDYIPAGGSGTYDQRNSIISFSDINLWTSNFDPNLILGGEYEYSFKGNVLAISDIRSDIGTYTYMLTKK